MKCWLGSTPTHSVISEGGYKHRKLVAGPGPISSTLPPIPSSKPVKIITYYEQNSFNYNLIILIPQRNTSNSPPCDIFEQNIENTIFLNSSFVSNKPKNIAINITIILNTLET